MSAWKRVNDYRWRRTDGAAVIWDDRSPYPNPVRPSARMWTAWEPDPSTKALSMRRGRLREADDGHLWKPRFPRRWNTPAAAMKAVDKEFPLRESTK